MPSFTYSRSILWLFLLLGLTFVLAQQDENARPLQSMTTDDGPENADADTSSNEDTSNMSDLTASAHPNGGANQLFHIAGDISQNDTDINIVSPTSGSTW